MVIWLLYNGMSVSQILRLNEQKTCELWKFFFEWWNFVAGGDPPDGSFVFSRLHQLVLLVMGLETIASHLCLHLQSPGSSKAEIHPRQSDEICQGDLHTGTSPPAFLCSLVFQHGPFLCRILWLVGCMFLPSYRHLLASISHFLSFFFDWFDFYIHCEIKTPKIPHSFYNIFIS